MAKSTETTSDLEICKRKIKAILTEYNCSIHSSDDWSYLYIEDNDTNKTTSFPD